MKTLAGALALGCCLLSASAADAQNSPGAFVAVDGGKIYYETCGSGPKNVVLLHDGVMHSAAFDAVWPTLCQRYHVVRYDRRGFGRSVEAKAPYSSTADTEAVMRAAAMDRATLVGGSEGGGLALAFAIEHPQAVDRLVLIGPSVSGLAVSDHFMRRTAAVIAALGKGGVGEAIKDKYIVAPDHEEARQQALAILLANPQNLTHRDLHQPTPPVRPRLGEIKAPTLILVGEDDIADVHAWAGALEALIPGARRVVMTDAGHAIYLEQPKAVTDQVIDFLR